MGTFGQQKKAGTYPLCLVGLSGLEPPTPTLSGWCSNLLSYSPVKEMFLSSRTTEIFGGGNRVRTDDPLLAGQVLSQLSYTPEKKHFVSNAYIA